MNILQAGRLPVTEPGTKDARQDFDALSME